MDQDSHLGTFWPTLSSWPQKYPFHYAKSAIWDTFWDEAPKWRNCLPRGLGVETFHRPYAPEECAWGALWPSQNSFARTCVVNTVLVCTLGLDSQLGAPCNGSGSSLHRTCVAEVTFYRPSATEGLDIQRRRAKGLDDDIFMRTPCKKRMGPPVDCDFVCTGARPN